MFAIAAGVWLLILAASVVLPGHQSLSAGSPAATDRVAGSMYWVALAAAVAMGFAPLVPPKVVASPEAATFSVDDAQAHIEAVAQQPHPIGSAALDDIRAYIISQLREMDLDPELQALSAPDYYGGSAATLPVVNVIARIDGTAPTGAIALVAHVDSFPSTPGANDNASGVAVLLETAKSLLAGPAVRNDVLLVFTDGEEPAPRYGSTPFVAEHRWSDEIRFVINLEAIGTAGPSLLSEAAGPRRWVLERYVDSAPYPAAFSFLTETTELIGGSNTDFAPFREAGIPGVELVYAHGSSIYHTAEDTPDRVSSRSLQAHGANTLALARDLAQTDLSAARSDDAMVFFTVGRYHVVRYPTSWAMALVVATGAAVFAALHRRTAWVAAARSALGGLVVALAIAVVATASWMLVAGWRDSMGVAESYAYLACLAALAAAVSVASLRARPGIGWKLRLDAIVLSLWMLGLLATLTVPGMSYLFAWPALAGALALWLGRSAGDPWRRLGPAMLTLGVAAAVLVPAIDTFFQFAQPRPGNPDSEILPTVAIPALLIAFGVQLALAFRVDQNAFATGDHDDPATTTPAATSLGRQPWDPANGLRIGTVSGGLIGVAAVLLTGSPSFWIVAGCGAVGGAIGFWTEWRKRRRPVADTTDPVETRPPPSPQSTL